MSKHTINLLQLNKNDPVIISDPIGAEDEIKNFVGKYLANKEVYYAIYKIGDGIYQCPVCKSLVSYTYEEMTNDVTVKLCEKCASIIKIC